MFEPVRTLRNNLREALRQSLPTDAAGASSMPRGERIACAIDQLRALATDGAAADVRLRALLTFTAATMSDTSDPLVSVTLDAHTVLDALRWCSRKPPVLAAALAALCKGMKHDRGIAAAVIDSVPIVVASMVKHAGVADVMAQACCAVRVLGYDANTSAAVHAAGGIEAVVAVLQGYGQHFRDVAVNGCLALHPFACTPCTAARVVAAGGVNAIAAVMTDAASASICVCRAVGAISTRAVPAQCR